MWATRRVLIQVILINLLQTVIAITSWKHSETNPSILSYPTLSNENISLHIPQQDHHTTITKVLDTITASLAVDLWAWLWVGSSLEHSIRGRFHWHSVNIMGLLKCSNAPTTCSSHGATGCGLCFNLLIINTIRMEAYQSGLGSKLTSAVRKSSFPSFVANFDAYYNILGWV